MDIITSQIIAQLSQPDINQIINRYPITPQAREIVQPNMKPADAIAVLQAADLERDAIQLIAHALPIMQSIRWGLDCLRQKQDWQPDELKVFDCVERWLASPNETLRIRAQQLAERIGLENASAWLGYAIFWSGTGSIVPADLPAVMPPDNMVGHAINAALLMAMV